MRTVEVFAEALCPFTEGGLHTLIGRRTECGLDDFGESDFG
ncbi:MAG: hypothetical protein WCH82_15220 [Mycobacteriaceae bacterium]